MARGRQSRWTPPLLTAAASLALLCAGGCGQAGGSAERDAPPAASFPAPEGRTLLELREDSAGSDLVVLPVGLVYDKGDRYGFGVFTVSKEQVSHADVAIYFSHGPRRRALGPYPARVESLETSAAFVSQTTGEDPEASKALYVVDDPPLGRDGEWSVLAMIRDADGSMAATFAPSIVVGHFPQPRPGFPRSPANPPDVGEPAPVVHTPTTDDVASIREIDTRQPPDEMHEDDLADVLGHEPVIIVFATPALCQSRTCGPVVDVTEEARQRFAGRIAFIHMEIYRENDPGKGVRPQVKAFRLPSEPWLFAIDREGIIRSRIEGAWSVADVEHAAEGLLDE